MHGFSLATNFHLYKKDKFKKFREKVLAMEFGNVEKMVKYFSEISKPSDKKIFYSIARKLEKEYLRKCLESFIGRRLTDKERREMRKILRVKKLKNGRAFYNLISNRIFIDELNPQTVIHEYAHWLRYKRLGKLSRIIDVLKRIKSYSDVAAEAYSLLAEIESLNILCKKFSENDFHNYYLEFWKDVREGKIDIENPFARGLYRLIILTNFSEKKYFLAAEFLMENVEFIEELKHMHPKDFEKKVKEWLKNEYVKKCAEFFDVLKKILK